MKFFGRDVKRTLFVSGIALVFSCLPAAAVEEGADRVDGTGWIEALDRRLNVAVHQGPPRFLDYLYEMDSGRFLEPRPDSWASYWAADIWVYFISDIDELGYLPKYIQDLVEDSEAEKASPAIASDFVLGRRFFQDQYGEDRSIVIVVVFVEHMKANVGPHVGCYSAGFLNAALENNLSRFINAKEALNCQQ